MAASLDRGGRRGARSSALPGISPSRGEIGLFVGGARPEARRPSKLLISTLEGEMSGRTEGGAVERDPE